MGKAALVNIDVEKGSEILRVLDHANVRVRVALWLYSPDYEDWRLVLSSKDFDQTDLVDAYGLLNSALDNAGIPLEQTPAILILSMSNPFVRTLRKIFGKAKSVEGMRLGGQMIGDRFVEDAYVYRVL